MMNCVLAGVGGQGTVLASRLIAQCAMNKGLQARTAETIGMAQRGGCVVSHVRVGVDIYSPLVALRSADVLIGFEPAEAVRNFAYLKEGGTVIISPKAVKPITAALAEVDYDGSDMIAYLRRRAAHLIVVDGDAICAACGSAKVLNIALLGAAAASGALGLSLAEIETAMKQILPPKHIAMNMQALQAGAQAVLKESQRS